MGVKLVKVNKDVMMYNNGTSRTYYPVSANQLVTFSRIWGVEPEEVFEALCDFDKYNEVVSTDFGVMGKFFLSNPISHLRK